MSNDPVIMINYDEERKEVSIMVRPDINPKIVPTILMEAAIKTALSAGQTSSAIMKHAETALTKEAVPIISPQTQLYS